MRYILIALFLWSSSFVAGKYAYSMLDPVLMVQMRLIIASFIVFPMFVRVWKRVPKTVRPQVWWLGFLNYPAIFLLQFIGLSHTSASSASTMLGLEPFLVVLIGHFFFGDKAKTHHWIFGLVAFLGVVLLIYGGEETGNISLFGCSLVLLAGIVFAACLRWTQRIIVQLTAQVYTTSSIVLGTITCLPFTLWLTQSWEIHWNWLGLAGLLYIGIGCSWLAYYLWNKGINSVDSNLAGILVSLEPVFAIILAVLLLGENISPLSWLGILAVVSTTLISSIYPRLLRRAS
ncbi:DMT family transporter [Aggregatibacter segnis]|uniref:DMT family transporter n=1 Tax=Aggregatibacter segnis TaxID=739 RepID=UPI000D687635|nr:DMT family transporter [Aggregatibacter segnis]